MQIKTVAAVFALCAVAAGAAEAGGVKAGKLRHQRCVSGDCNVEVGATRPLAGSDCRVEVPDVVFVQGAVGALLWKLKPGADGKVTHRFAAQRVSFDDNDTSDTPVPSGVRHFDDEPLDTAAQTDRKRLVAGVSRRWKVFTYTLHLQWLAGDGATWTNCTPHDPIIVNTGN